jgi:hypothetical protein
MLVNKCIYKNPLSDANRNNVLVLIILKFHIWSMCFRKRMDFTPDVWRGLKDVTEKTMH